MNNKFKILLKEDVNFPQKLLEMEDAPDVLYVMGNEKILNEFSIAIVGSRKCSRESAELARMIAEDLCESTDVAIISGFAVGVDTMAHLGAINKKGKTIAVLGGGFNYIYPKTNIPLINKIIDAGGAIISEYMPNDIPNKIFFHNRNRIIAALSSGIVVIEAKDRSGSLVTARYGKKFDKKIFVVPGDLYNKSFEGSNELLAKGGICIRNCNDILSHYSEITIKKIKKKNIDVPEELQLVYSVIDKKGKTADDIANEINRKIYDVLPALTMLEIKGLIKQYPGKIFSL